MGIVWVCLLIFLCIDVLPATHFHAFFCDVSVLVMKQNTWSWNLFIGQAQGKRTGAAQKKGKRRTGNGKGATKNSKKGRSYFISSFTCGDNQRPSGTDFLCVVWLHLLFSSLIINLSGPPQPQKKNLKRLELYPLWINFIFVEYWYLWSFILPVYD